AAGRLLDTGDELHRGRLAGPVDSHDAVADAGLQGEVHPVEDGATPPVGGIDLGDVLEADHGSIGSVGERCGSAPRPRAPRLTPIAPPTTGEARHFAPGTKPEKAANLGMPSASPHGRSRALPAA